MKLLRFLLLALIVSCIPRQYKFEYTHSSHSIYTIPLRTIPIYIDKEFSANDKIGIDNAVWQWNFSLNNWTVLNVVDYNFDFAANNIERVKQERGWMILRVMTGNPTIPDEDGQLTGAWVNKIGGDEIRIVIDRIDDQKNEENNRNKLTAITIHEIGHLIGCLHNNNRYSIMYPRYSAILNCVDKDTVQQVAKINHLELNTLNWCYAIY